MALGTSIITVGDEILGGFIADTNSRHLAKRAFHAGYPVQRIAVVGDDPALIAGEVRAAVADDAISRIVVSGGLGPTPDDRTVEGVSLGLGRSVEEHPAALAHITGVVARMHAAGWVPTAGISDANRKMASAPAEAQVLENRRGMAPPLLCDLGADKLLFVLPGVPREFTVIVDEVLMPTYFVGGAAPIVEERRFTGIPEAEFAPTLRRLGQEFADVVFGSYPQSESRDLIIRARGSDPNRIAAALRRLEELGPSR